MYAQIPLQNWKPALSGTVTSCPQTGYYITPTIIDNPPEDSRIVQEEPFGPIVPLLKWRDENDVIDRANALRTGLGSSVWSKDITRAEGMARRLEAGSVWVNSHFALGNVRILREMLDKREALRGIIVIGTGGVEDKSGFERIKHVGAGAVGVRTALGRKGVKVFREIIQG